MPCPFGQGVLFLGGQGLSFEAEKCYNIAVFVKGCKTSETETDIGQELIGLIKRQMEADNPFHP